MGPNFLRLGLHGLSKVNTRFSPCGAGGDFLCGIGKIKNGESCTKGSQKQEGNWVESTNNKQEFSQTKMLMNENERDIAEIKQKTEYDPYNSLIYEI